MFVAIVRFPHRRQRLLPFHLADVSSMKRHWRYYVDQYYLPQQALPLHMRVSFPR